MPGKARRIAAQKVKTAAPAPKAAPKAAPKSKSPKAAAKKPSKSKKD